MVTVASRVRRGFCRLRPQTSPDVVRSIGRSPEPSLTIEAESEDGGEGGPGINFVAYTSVAPRPV